MGLWLGLSELGKLGLSSAFPGILKLYRQCQDVFNESGLHKSKRLCLAFHV